MKLLIIRHGDPDYEKDTLTAKGWREAELLGERLSRQKIDYYYVSPLGRAQDTAKPTLEKAGKKAEVREWLHEFDLKRIHRPDVSDRRMIAWDWLPADWMSEERFFRADLWDTQPAMAEGEIGDYFRSVTTAFDELLCGHGYRRNGHYYDVVRPNTDVIALFCHQGAACVLLSHLLSVSPMTLWHGIALAPSSVTTVVTEERRPGIACFRATGIGDISHLYAADEEPSPSARFCECYTHKDERHD